MKKFRFILAILFISEVATVICHLLIGIVFNEEYPLIAYVIMPVTALGCILLSYVLTPVINWIIGA